LDIVAGFPCTRIFERAFDTHAKQWNFAIQETGIQTPWVLALDADYVLSSDFVDELRSLGDHKTNAGYSASFRYCVHGIPLRRSLYPPLTVLFRRDRAYYVQEGHTQRLKLSGPVQSLQAKIDHDDRKSLSHWLKAQDCYARLEAEHISQTTSAQLTLPDRIRRYPVVAPFLTFIYCYFGKRVFLDGSAGLYYAFQRLLAETLLALRLLEIQRNRRLEGLRAREPSSVSNLFGVLDDHSRP
jgi:hypothetical protein